MKRIFQHPPAPETGKRYWRSLAELEDSQEFRESLAREFPAGAAELEMDGVSRRNFLKLMGASTALAGLGLSGCRRPTHKLLPFTDAKEWEIPGKPLFYATAMPRRGGTLPLVVATNDGRPTKIDGNPKHPVTRGKSDLHAQAAVLGLYDPDRSKTFVQAGNETDEAAFRRYLGDLLERHGGDSGAGMAFLLDENPSPTRERLRSEIAERFPQAQWCVYEPLGAANATRAAQAGFGEGVQAVLNFDAADVIVSLDSDFLGTDDQAAYYARQFSDRRNVKQADGRPMNRLYVAESCFTVTGGMADHRLRIPSSHMGAFALALARQIGATQAGGFQSMFETEGVTFPEGWIEELARDLQSARGRSLVVAGPRQPVAVHLIANAINAALGNLGETITGIQATERPGIDLVRLAQMILGKQITSLFVLGGNPVYNAPADLLLPELMKLVPDTIRLGLRYDETSAFCRWHVPGTHFLEAWGDGRAVDGSYVSIQPMILPLYDGWSELDLLAIIAGRDKPAGLELVQETFRLIAGDADFDEAWNSFVREGYMKDLVATPRSLFFNTAGASAALVGGAPPAQPIRGEDIEVVLTASSAMDDGRYANVSWLQEVPDPVTKLTWDNALLMSPALANRLGIKAPAGELGQVEGDIIKIEVGDRAIEAAALILPGHADNSVTIALGWGRRMAGGVSAGTGVDAYPLLTSTGGYILTGAKLSKTGRSLPLAVTQDHWSMEGRGFVREASMATYQETPDFAQHMALDAHTPPSGFTSLYGQPPLDGPHQWGMTIDLNVCNGCSACMVACQAENNIPVVGKEQVLTGREMHWMRMDRYFASSEGGEQDPEMLPQPMLCQHCENAPCETVCPVNATVHSNEGLNVMAYNRCIGTRYCANNCPFKVRRFNFFDYNQRPIEMRKFGPFEVQGLYLGPLTKKGSPDTVKMQKNPNVTVRMRGVMEKCTFCVQRIEEAKIASKVRAGASSAIQIPTDAFQVACQQACPSDAIVFGNLNDPESRVSKVKAEERNYRLLEYLNVKTRVSYLARIRNLNPRMPAAQVAAGPGEAKGHGGAPAHEPASHATPKHEGDEA